jgi:Mg-chelatase subunit ChlD
VKEGEDARRAVAEAGRRTTSRRDLARHGRFEEVSPEVGELDEDAFERALDEDPDAALALLADLTGATDERLRELARRLAGRVIVDVASIGAPRRRGVGRMARERAGRTLGDLDVDASLDAVLEARADRRPPHLDDLTVRAWRRPDTALCLLVDRSGSMLGERLAAAAVAAAAVAYRNSADCSVVAFSDEAIVLKSQEMPRSADELVGDLLRLRGHGTTDVGLAVRTAREQLSRSHAGRKVAVLLSDCRPTTGGDPTSDAARLDELAIVAPAGDLADAEALAAAVGARCVPLDGPAHVPEAIAAALLG